MVSNRRLFLSLISLVIFISSCRGNPAALDEPVQSGSPGNIAGSTTTDAVLPTSTQKSTGESPTTIPSETPAALSYCPDVIPADTPWPDDVQITEIDLNFDVIQHNNVPGEIFWNDAGFVSLTDNLDGTINVNGLSNDGLHWEIFDFPNRPEAENFGFVIFPAENYSKRPGLGGQVELLTGLGPSGLCMPGPDGVGKEFQLVPFGNNGDFQEPLLIGTAGDTIFMLISYGEPPNFVIDLGNVKLKIEKGTEIPVMTDLDTGKTVTFGSSDDGAKLIYEESGEVFVEVSQEEFITVFTAASTIRDATRPPLVDYLAWTGDRGLSWTISEIPGQTPERDFRVRGSVSPDGTVALLVSNSPFGQLINPDDISAQLSQEDIDAAMSERTFQEFEYLAMRANFQVE